MPSSALEGHRRARNAEHGRPRPHPFKSRVREDRNHSSPLILIQWGHHPSSIIHHPSSIIHHPSSFPAPVIGNLELMPLRMNIGK